MSSTFNIANSLKRSVYDSLYLALAVTDHCQMVTADQKLYNAIRSSSLAAYLCWLEDVPETSRQQE